MGEQNGIIGIYDLDNFVLIDKYFGHYFTLTYIGVDEER
jgi:hypothetical protein